jgi:hypothetical protein
MRSMVRIIAITLNVLVGGFQLWIWGLMATSERGPLGWGLFPYLVVPLLSLLAPVSAIAAIVLVPSAGSK